MRNLSEIHRNTIAVYETHASEWDNQRSLVFFEEDWVKRFQALVPPKGTILDVGCGSGRPIAQYFIDEGFELVGIDASPAMINMCRSRFPRHEWGIMDMRELSLPHMFDGIIAWDSFFHLNPHEQESTLGLFCEHLKPDASLLLTIGEEAGEILGSINGHEVYHSSLEPEKYRDILHHLGFSNVSVTLCDKNCREHSVLLASGFQPKTNA